MPTIFKVEICLRLSLEGAFLSVSSAIGNGGVGIHNTRLLLKNAKRMVEHKGRLGIATVFCAVLLDGCVLFPLWHYGPDKQTREDFEQRVEAAFRFQNQMTSEVMVLQDTSQDLKKQEAIFRAEQEMQKACNYLNEYASKEMDGLDTGFLLLNEVESSVASCETAAHRLETILKGL